ncbi:unnamed protein product [Pedinophyceae sp. YPF-701]|nr:unnamed protein product [Pedinophyceae sp. YPF-701]
MVLSSSSHTCQGPRSAALPHEERADRVREQHRAPPRVDLGALLPVRLERVESCIACAVLKLQPGARKDVRLEITKHAKLLLTPRALHDPARRAVKGLKPLELRGSPAVHPRARYRLLDERIYALYDLHGPAPGSPTRSWRPRTASCAASRGPGRGQTAAARRSVGSRGSSANGGRPCRQVRGRSEGDEEAVERDEAPEAEEQAQGEEDREELFALGTAQ